MEEDPKIAAKTRSFFNEKGLYGKRIVVHKKSGDQLPYPDFMFNFICVDINYSILRISVKKGCV